VFPRALCVILFSTENNLRTLPPSLCALCVSPCALCYSFYTENKRGYTENNLRTLPPFPLRALCYSFLHGEQKRLHGVTRRIICEHLLRSPCALCFPVCSVLFLLHGEQKRLHGVTRRIICEHFLHSSVSSVFPRVLCVILFTRRIICKHFLHSSVRSVRSVLFLLHRKLYKKLMISFVNCSAFPISTNQDWINDVSLHGSTMCVTHLLLRRSSLQRCFSSDILLRKRPF